MREVWNSVLFVRPQNVAVKVRFLNANFMEVLKLIFSLNFERFSDLPGLLEPSSLFFGETQSSQSTQWETKRACYGGESCTKGVLWSFKFSTGVQLGGEFPVKVSYCPYHILLYLIWELSKHDGDDGDGDGWQERHNTKGLISKAMTLRVRYRLWYISLPSSAKKQREMTKFKVLCRTWTHDSEFSFFYLNCCAVLTESAPSQIVQLH